MKLMPASTWRRIWASNCPAVCASSDEVGSSRMTSARGSLVTVKGNTVLLDAYNANPSSVEMALMTFEKMQGEKMTLLGDMFELGSYEDEEHRAIAALCEKLDVGTSILIGEAFYRTGPDTDRDKKFRTKKEAFEMLSGLDQKKRLVLIKGSRGMKMEDFLTEF